MRKRDERPGSLLKHDASIAGIAFLSPLVVVLIVVLVGLLAIPFLIISLLFIIAFGENSSVTNLFLLSYPLAVIGIPTVFLASVLFETAISETNLDWRAASGSRETSRWILSKLWWVGFPIVLLVPLAAHLLGYVRLPVTGLEMLVTNAIVVYAGFTIVTRLYRVFVSFYDGRSVTLESLLVYPFVAGLLDIVLSSLFGTSSLRALDQLGEGSEFESDEQSGFVWVYLWLVAVAEILEVIVGSGTEGEDYDGSSLLLFDGSTGDGLIEATTIGFIVLPVLVVALPLVVSGRRVILERGLRIGRISTVLLVGLARTLATWLSYLLFLRPRR